MAPIPYPMFNNHHINPSFEQNCEIKILQNGVKKVTKVLNDIKAESNEKVRNLTDTMTTTITQLETRINQLEHRFALGENQMQLIVQELLEELNTIKAVRRDEIRQLQDANVTLAEELKSLRQLLNTNSSLSTVAPVAEKKQKKEQRSSIVVAESSRNTKEKRKILETRRITRSMGKKK